MAANETYVVTARTERSSTSVGTGDPVDALKRAQKMAGLGAIVSIIDLDGNQITIDELEAKIAAGE